MTSRFAVMHLENSSHSTGTGLRVLGKSCLALAGQGAKKSSYNGFLAWYSSPIYALPGS